MAKKQSSGTLFERAGFALGASKLKMQHHDYVKSLGDSLDFSMKKSEQDKDKPKKEGTQDAETVKYVQSIKNEIADLMRIKEGKKKDPLYPSTDAQIDFIYGPGASEKAMMDVKEANQKKKTKKRK
mgnify:CR=1 FL=1